MAATLDHFRSKLVELEGMMKTGEGTRLAAARTERLRTFGSWWLEEMCMIDQEIGDMTWVQGPPPPTPERSGPSGQGSLIGTSTIPTSEDRPQPGPSSSQLPIQPLQEPN